MSKADDKYKEWFIPGADEFDKLFEKTKGLARYYYNLFADKEDQAFEGWFEDQQQRASFYYYNASFNLNENIPTAIFVVIVLVVAFYFRRQIMKFISIITKWIKKFFQPKPPENRGDPFGTSKFASPNDFKPTKDNPNPLGTPRTGVFFGRMETRAMQYTDARGNIYPIPSQYGESIYSAPESNVLIFAPSRTGKGTSIIVPTLAGYENSVFCLDPKGQNAAITGLFREKTLGQKVYMINPWGLLQKHIHLPSSRINPLDLIRVDDPNAVSLAGFLVDFLMPPNLDPTEGFWDESAKTVLLGLILYTVAHEPENATLANVRRLVTLPEKEFDEITGKMILSDCFDGTLAETGGTILNMTGNTRANVMTTAQAHTFFLSNPIVKESLGHSDFSFDVLKQQPSTVFVIIPAPLIKTQTRWLRLMVGMALTAFEQGEEQFKNRCLFLIDEFPALGRMEKIETGIATLSGYGVDMALICQDLGQLKKYYGEDGRSSLMANCRDKYFCNISDKETADLVSAMMGNETIKVKSYTETSTTTSLAGRRLEMPEELLQKGKKIGYIIRTGSRPIMVEPQHYYNFEPTKAFTAMDPYYHPSGRGPSSSPTQPSSDAPHITKKSEKELEELKKQFLKAAEEGKTDVINRLFGEIEMKDLVVVGPNALKKAVYGGYHDIVEKLLENGIIIVQTGETWYWVMENGTANVKSLFKDMAKTIKLNGKHFWEKYYADWQTIEQLQEPDNNGATGLMYAAMAGEFNNTILKIQERAELGKLETADFTRVDEHTGTLLGYLILDIKLEEAFHHRVWPNRAKAVSGLWEALSVPVQRACGINIKAKIENANHFSNTQNKS